MHDAENAGSPRTRATLDAQGDRRPKMAERLAGDLTRWITDNHLLQGTPLGTEISLAERLGASRWIIREAIGMLEREGQVAIRRGRNGGIFVARPPSMP